MRLRTKYRHYQVKVAYVKEKTLRSAGKEKAAEVEHHKRPRYVDKLYKEGKALARSFILDEAEVEDDSYLEEDEEEDEDNRDYNPDEDIAFICEDESDTHENRSLHMDLLRRQQIYEEGK